MAQSATEGGDRIETVKAYFRKVDAGEADLVDLFADDVEIFFPKFGLGRGKAGFGAFARRMQGYLASIGHDIAGFRYHVADDVVVVEGREWGVTRAGLAWPDGDVSEGRFSSVFEFDGPLIRRMYIYVDPDFTSADHDRIAILRGDRSGNASRAVLSGYFAALRGGATPEAVAALFSEDVDWDIPGAVDRVPWIGPRRGRDGVADFVRQLRVRIESLRFDIHALTVEGDRAIASGYLESRVVQTGLVIRTEFTIDATVRDGLITRYRMLEDSVAVAAAADPAGEREGIEATARTRMAVQRFVDAVKTRQPPEAIAALFAEEIDWNVPGPVDRLPWIGRRHGRAGIAQFYRDLLQNLEPERYEIHSVLADGDRAVVSGEFASRIRRTGKLAETPFLIEITVRDGLITRYRFLEDSHAVAQAASD